jgi:hypothetical protein
MKDKELELEETETPHTLGGLGEDRVQLREREVVQVERV